MYSECNQKSEEEDGQTVSLHTNVNKARCLFPPSTLLLIEHFGSQFRFFQFLEIIFKPTEVKLIFLNLS